VLVGKCDGLTVRYINGKGRAVFTTSAFHKDEFVIEYLGDLIEKKEAFEREEQYDLANLEEGYMFYFEFQGRVWCVDATPQSELLGRLINHSKSAPNLTPLIVPIKGVPHLVLKAKRNVEAGEELVYDYGERRKPLLKALPWLTK